MFGLKFWAMVVGAAPLDPELEAFWGRLGFVVVQGYGLTETAPIVTLNHPLHARRGTVGKPIAGVEIRIAADGEILVRGDNVTTGYFNAPEATREAFADGWFHTGDIGELDAEGQLHIKGRKKEMIVTPEGLNVFPEDVERVLNEQPGVIDSAVVGAPLGRQHRRARPRRPRCSRPAPSPMPSCAAANAALDDHQTVRRTVGVAGAGTAAHRRHAQAEAPRAADLARGQARLPAGPPAARPQVGSARARRSVLARFAPGPHDREDDDDRRAGPDVRSIASS